MKKNLKSLLSLHHWKKNWILKLSSFFFALLLWYFVVGEDKVDRTLFIPMEIVNLPQELVISNQFKRELEVTINGPRGLIKSLNRHDVTRAVDLTDASPGTVAVRNDLNSIPFPHGIRVLRIQPPSIILLLDKLLHKNLQIKAVIKGQPPEGYEMTEISLEPPSMPITGPQVIVGDLNMLTTNPINLTGLKVSAIKQVSLDLNADIASLIGETVINVKITVKEQLLEKTITNIPIKLHHANPKINFHLKPKTISVKANLPYHLAQDKKKLKTFFEAAVNAGELPLGNHKLKVDVTSAHTVKIYEINPEMVLVDLLPIVLKGKIKKGKMKK